MPERDPPDAEAAKLAAILIELRSLAAKAEGSRGPTEALEDIRAIQKHEMGAQISRWLNTRLEWWQVITSPIHTRRLLALRRRDRTAGEIERSRSDWHEVHRLVTSIQFGYALDAMTADHLRRLIDAGILSARDAWRLTHSLGCRVTSGSLMPAPVSKGIAAGGLCSGAIAFGVGLVFALQAAAGLVGSPHQALCVTVGCAVVVPFLFGVGFLFISCTWGRRDAARVLDALFSRDLVHTADASTRARSPLMRRLAW